MEDNKQPEQQPEPQQEEEPQLIEREIEGVTVIPPPFIQDPITSDTTIIVKQEVEPSADTRDESSRDLLKTIHCRLCDCKILTPNNAKLVEKQITLVHKKQSNTAEELKFMWFLPDMFSFENVAFSKDVNASHKYLTCAECEAEVIGIHYIDSKENYVAHDRIIYK